MAERAGRVNLLTRAKRSLVRRQWRLNALRAISRALIPDYRVAWFQLDWLKDPWFNDFLDRFGERASFDTHRRWTVWQLLRLVHDVEGETAECGVYLGASSYLICAGSGGRTHHLFDSFEGLSAPAEHDDRKVWVAGDLSAGEAVVQENLAAYVAQCVFHKGWIPHRFADVADRAFAFVHVDVDLYQPTADSIAFFYPRLNGGGILLCDDYGFSTCPGATKAVDEFLADKPEKMIKLDSGGGFIIKGVASPIPAP
jgi:hypothetical protein